MTRVNWGVVFSVITTTIALTSLAVSITLYVADISNRSKLNSNNIGVAEKDIRELKDANKEQVEKTKELSDILKEHGFVID